MKALKGKWFVLVLAGLLVAGPVLIAGCSGDDKDDGGPTGNGAFTDPCDLYCERMCQLAVQCGETLAGECTREKIIACGDDAEALIKPAACQEALGVPWDCSIFSVPQ